MGVKHLFLALLSQQSMHGYELKTSFDRVMFEQWNLNFGQVYTTLTRLERDGLLYWEDVPQGDKPDKKVYHITQKGREVFKEWLDERNDWNIYSDEMAFKFTAFQLVDKEISRDILNSYRIFLLQLIKHLTLLRDSVPKENIIQELTIERNILKAEADIKWIDLCNEKWGVIE